MRQAPWTLERCPWLFHPFARVGREKSGFGGTHGAFGGGPGLVWSEAPFGCPVPRPPKPTPQDSVPAGPIPSWGHHTPPGCLGAYLVASHACFGPILCPCAMTGPRACEAPNGNMTQDTSKREETWPDLAGAPMVPYGMRCACLQGRRVPGRKVAVGDIFDQYGVFQEMQSVHAYRLHHARVCTACKVAKVQEMRRRIINNWVGIHIL